MELRIGKMTSRELAEWFGIAYTTYKKAIPKYLNKLEDYAVFTAYRGGVNITEIFIYVYNKHLNFDRDVAFAKMVKNSKHHLATISGFAERDIMVDATKKESSLRYQYTKSRDKLFGTMTKDSQDNKSDGGILGCRYIVWGIKLDIGEYRPLTKEEDDLFDTLIKNFYGSNVDKIKLSMLLEEQFRNTNMTKEEYFAIKDAKGFNFYHEVIKQFKQRTGLTLSSPNLYEFGENFELTPDEREYRKRIMEVLNND